MLRNCVKRTAVQDSAIQNSYRTKTPSSDVSIIRSVDEKIFTVTGPRQDDNCRPIHLSQNAYVDDRRWLHLSESEMQSIIPHTDTCRSRIQGQWSLISYNVMPLQQLMPTTGLCQASGSSSFNRTIRYDTIRYGTVDLRAHNSWRDSQLSLAQGTETKIKKKTNNKKQSSLEETWVHRKLKAR